MASSRIQKVFLDMLVLEEFCNGRCLYCEGFYRTGYRMRKGPDGRMRLPSEWRAMLSSSPAGAYMPLSPTADDFFSLAAHVINSIRALYDVSILKLSGGEVFLYEGLLEFVKSQSAHFPAVQILTNATIPSDQDVEMLAGIENLILQVSLDGTDPNSNRTRNCSERGLKRVLRNLSLASRAGIPLELNCVLTRHNAATFPRMLEWLSANAPTAVVLPRPVRGAPRATLDPSPEQVRALRTFFERHLDGYAHLLPPEAYLQRVLTLMERGRREWTCTVPQFVLGASNYGDIPECIRTGGASRYGNVLDKDFDPSLSSMTSSPGQPDDECSYCLVQYELLGMLAEGSIRASEIAHVPTFAVPGVIEKVLLVPSEGAE